MWKLKVIFSVRQIPRLAWSSASPFNLRPGLLTLFYLNIGLVLFGLIRWIAGVRVN